jgi:dihydroorotate dehydrogenase (fumarate)
MFPPAHQCQKVQRPPLISISANWSASSLGSRLRQPNLGICNAFVFRLLVMLAVVATTKLFHVQKVQKSTYLCLCVVKINHLNAKDGIVLAAIIKTNHMANLSSHYLGLPIKSPIIASSSGLTSSVKDVVELANQGAGAVVLKSLFEEEIVVEMEKQMGRMFANSYLYPETMEYYENEDTEDTLTNYLSLIGQCKQAVQIPIIASINCVTANNWPSFARSLQDAGADALELNVFVLPSNLEAASAENEQLLFDVLKNVKKEVTIPVSIKMSYYFSSLGATITKLSQAGADGIVLFNRFYSPDIDLDVLDVVSANVFSTPADYHHTLQWMGLLGGRGLCDLSASTGIHDSQTATKMILAGAQTVQVASCLYKHGVGHLAQLTSGLSKWMDEKGFEKIDDFRGILSQSQVANPAGYERLQFMKYFAKK